MDTTRSERAKQGHADAVARGAKLGAPQRVTDAQILRAAGLGTADGAALVGLSKAQFAKRRKLAQAAAV